MSGIEACDNIVYTASCSGCVVKIIFAKFSIDNFFLLALYSTCFPFIVGNVLANVKSVLKYIFNELSIPTSLPLVLYASSLGKSFAVGKLIFIFPSAFTISIGLPL